MPSQRDSRRSQAAFRRELVRRINRDGSGFRLSTVVDETGIDTQQARQVAEAVFVRFYASVIDDGELSDRERRHLRQLADRLEIDDGRRREIETELAGKAVEDRLREAQADGVVTADELQEIQQLKQGFGLSQQERPQPAPVHPLAVLDSDTKSQPALHRKRDRSLALVRSSPQYARRDAPQRIERARAAGQKRKLFLFACAVLLSCTTISSAVTLAWIGNTPANRGQLLGMACIGGIPFGIPALLVWFFCWRIHSRRSLPITSSALVVHSKRVARKKVDRHGEESGPYYYAMFEGDGGRRIEYELCDAAMAERFFIGDAGVLFVQGERVIDFDCVRTAETTRERHIVGAVVCSNCQTVYELDQVPENCRNCGAALPKSSLSDEEPVERRNVSVIFGIMERWSERIWLRNGMLHEIGAPTLKQQVEGHVTCGWCRHRYESRPDANDCLRCGGVLPMPPGHDPGPKPPSPPRKLPGAIYAVVYWKSNGILKTGLQLMTGGFCCFCIPPISMILLFCGFMSVIHGLIVARRRIAALKRGVAVPGQIENIQWIGNPPSQEKGTRRVFYRFEADGEPLRAMFYSYDSSIEKRFTGEPIWVVTVPGKPHLCAAWPPFA